MEHDHHYVIYPIDFDGKRIGTLSLRADNQAMYAKMRQFVVLQGGASLEDIVAAVNQVGAAPGDLIAILEALKQAGALRAEFGLPLPELSMGMTGDFEAAIEEGATLVRIGTKIFGERGTI